RTGSRAPERHPEHAPERHPEHAPERCVVRLPTGRARTRTLCGAAPHWPSTHPNAVWCGSPLAEHAPERCVVRLPTGRARTRTLTSAPSCSANATVCEEIANLSAQLSARHLGSRRTQRSWGSRTGEEGGKEGGGSGGRSGGEKWGRRAGTWDRGDTDAPGGDNSRMPAMRPTDPRAGTQPRGDEIAKYETYLEAQRAVDYLADHEFTVNAVTIVGTELKLVERITGRRTYPSVAGRGAASGAYFGSFIGLLDRKSTRLNSS